jgi:hypothetical protein
MSSFTSPRKILRLSSRTSLTPATALIRTLMRLFLINFKDTKGPRKVSFYDTLGPSDGIRYSCDAFANI